MARQSLRFKQLLPADGWVVPVLSVDKDKYGREMPAIDYRGVVAWAWAAPSEGEAEGAAVIPLVVDEEGAGDVIPLPEWRRLRCGPGRPFLDCRAPVLESTITPAQVVAWGDEARRLPQHHHPCPEFVAAD